MIAISRSRNRSVQKLHSGGKAYTPLFHVMIDNCKCEKCPGLGFSGNAWLLLWLVLCHHACLWPVPLIRMFSFVNSTALWKTMLHDSKKFKNSPVPVLELTLWAERWPSASMLRNILQEVIVKTHHPIVGDSSCWWIWNCKDAFRRISIQQHSSFSSMFFQQNHKVSVT